MSKKAAREAIQTPKGAHDILPSEMPYWDRVLKLGEELALFYGFKKIETPHFEKTDLFARTLGETTDIVEKQMYSFRTRGGDALTLRPEGTAPVARAFIEHGMSNLPQPVKLFYSGSFFRHENPQRGRFREFRQFGLEIFGDDDAVSDALVIRLFYTMLEELGFKEIAVHVNSIGDEESRTAYKKELSNFYRRKINSLCKDCKRRLKENPLRLLDCKDESCVELRETAPQMIKYLTDTSKRHFKSLLEFLDEGKVPYYLNQHLVRGLDYYTGTVFEIFVNCRDGEVPGVEKEESAESAKEGPANRPAPIALAGGGRYDGLVHLLGGRPTPAVGGALGLDRVIREMKDAGIDPMNNIRPRIFIAQLGPAAKKKSFGLMENFRKAGIPVAESLSRDSIKTQLKIADKIEADYALIVGQKEALDGTVIVREMTTGAQETIYTDKIVEDIRNRFKNKKAR